MSGAVCLANPPRIGEISMRGGFSSLTLMLMIGLNLLFVLEEIHES